MAQKVRYTSTVSKSKYLSAKELAMHVVALARAYGKIKFVIHKWGIGYLPEDFRGHRRYYTVSKVGVGRYVLYRHVSGKTVKVAEGTARHVEAVLAKHLSRVIRW